MNIGDLKLKALGIKFGLNLGYDLKLIKPQFSKKECIRIMAAVSPAKCLLQVLELIFKFLEQLMIKEIFYLKFKEKKRI